jgi:hypothetical protein
MKDREEDLTMFRLRIWDKEFKEIDVIEREAVSTLLEIGKLLQKEFGAHYRLETLPRGGVTP